MTPQTSCWVCAESKGHLAAPSMLLPWGNPGSQLGPLPSGSVFPPTKESSVTPVKAQSDFILALSVGTRTRRMGLAMGRDPGPILNSASGIHGPGATGHEKRAENHQEETPGKGELCKTHPSKRLPQGAQGDQASPGMGRGQGARSYLQCQILGSRSPAKHMNRILADPRFDIEGHGCAQEKVRGQAEASCHPLGCLSL